MSIKNTIRKLRTDHDFTQEYVAETLGLSTKWYGKIENNKAQPTIEKIAKLKELYQCELADIFDFSTATVFNNINQQGTYIAQNFHEKEKTDEQVKEQYEVRLKEKDSEIAFLRGLLGK